MPTYSHPQRQMYQPPPKTAAGRLFNTLKSVQPRMVRLAQLLGSLICFIWGIALWPFSSRRKLLLTSGAAGLIAVAVWWLTWTDPIEAAARSRMDLDHQQLLTLNVLHAIGEDARNFTSPAESLDDQVLRSCRLWVGVTLDRQDALATQLDRCRAALLHAVKAYRRAAAAYENFAIRARRDSGSLAEGYTLLAENSRENAGVLQARAEAVSRTWTELARSLRFLKDSMLFLERVDFFEKAQGRRAQRDYVQQLSAFAREAGAARTFFDQLSAAFGEDPTPVMSQQTTVSTNDSQ